MTYMKRTSRRQLLRKLLAAPLPELPRGARRQLISQMADRILTYWQFRNATVATPKNMRASLRRLSESTSALKEHIGQLPASTKRGIGRVAGGTALTGLPSMV
jgi:RNase H-fold protein (predicted Holliday junction resolvase)